MIFHVRTRNGRHTQKMDVMAVVVLIVWITAAGRWDQKAQRKVIDPPVAV